MRSSELSCFIDFIATYKAAKPSETPALIQQQQQKKQYVYGDLLLLFLPFDDDSDFFCSSVFGKVSRLANPCILFCFLISESGSNGAKVFFSARCFASAARRP